MRVRISLSYLTIALAVTALFGCGPATNEPIDVGHIAGRWMLDTGGETEWFHLEESGTFTAEIRGNGFVATTLSDGPRVKLSGRWTLEGRSLRFEIDASNDEALAGEPHVYQIVELTNREMLTTDSAGDQRKLLRGM